MRKRIREPFVPTENYPTVKRELASIGITITKTKDQSGEYRVNFKGGAESTAYYTNDLGDALSTGIDMAKQAGSSPLRVAVNLPAQLASAGFVQNLKKSTVNFTWWERDNASAITSGNGYLLWVGEDSMGGSTPTHLAEHLKALKTTKLTSDKLLRVVFTHEVDIEPAITPQQLLDMVLDGSYTWSDMGEVEIQNHLGQVLARQIQENDEGSYQAFTPKDGSAGEKRRVEANLNQEAMADMELYRFFERGGSFIMIAPMSTAQKLWRLHDDAITRAEHEVKTLGECVWHKQGIVVKPNLVTMKRGGGQ